MSRITPFKLNTIEGIARGEKATVRLQNGPTYQELVIESNIAPDMISKFTVDIGGVYQIGEILAVTGEEAYMLEKYHGRNQVAYKYVLAFGSTEGRTDKGQLFSGLVTLPSDNIILGIELKASTSTVVPTFTGWAFASAAQPVRVLVPQIKSQIITNTAIGDIDFPHLPVDAAIQRIHLLGDVDKAIIIKDGNQPFELTKSVNNFMLMRNEKAPQAGYFHIDFVQRGWVLMDMFNPVNVANLNLRLTMTAANNVRVLIESVRQLAAPQS
jgi:hypothetical protein